MALWLPGFEVVKGEDSGDWAADNEDAPKIVLHTTEGPAGSAQGAFASFKANRSWPHLTVDPTTRQRWQHVPLNKAARALRNTSAPGQTNREGRTYQIEIVGRSAQSPSRPKTELDWLGTDVLRPLADATGAPLRTSVTFYGEDAGWILASASARQRLSAAAFDTYTGVLGHQHVPENTHWDPGALDVARILAAANGTNPSPEEDDMSPEDRAKLAEMDAKLDRLLADSAAQTGRLEGVKVRIDNFRKAFDKHAKG